MQPSSPVPFISPLKRVDSIARIDTNSRVKKKINFSNDSLENRVQEAGSSTLNPFNFNPPAILPSQLDFQSREVAVREDASKIEALKIQVQLIEGVLANLNNKKLIEQCKERVQFLLTLNNYETQMAELGMLLFYLDSQKKVPQTKLLVEVRANAIENEVKSYIANHQEKRLDSLIPSGKTHYMMRALAHMILTSTQKFNRGGLFAIQEMLTNAKYKISMYLQPEHRIHILNIVNQLLTDRNFEELFSQEIRIHPTLEDVTRLDLKLPINARIDSVHVLYACIMSLFADIRQFDEPNCYAVGSLIYATENHTYTTLAKLVQVLTTGSCVIDQGVQVPLRPLLEKRLSYCKDFDLMVSPSHANQSVPWIHMHEMLELKSVESPQKNMKLGDLLESILHANKAGQKREYATKFYKTFKFSAYVILQLAMIEFTHINVQKDDSWKNWIIESMIEAIENGAKKNLPTETRTKYQQNLIKRLWLENCNESDIRFEKGALYVGTKKLQEFKADIMKFGPLFKRSLRVYSLTKNLKGHDDYSLIWSFSDLSRVLEDVFRETEKELSATKNMHSLLAMVQKAVVSKEFRTYISEKAAKQIGGQFQISGKELNDANLLIFNQKGGVEVDALREVYGIQTGTVNFEGSNSPLKFMKKLLKWIAASNLKSKTMIPKLLMTTLGGHVWTLTPSCWEHLNHRNDFDGFINDTVFAPVNRRLNSWIPEEVMLEVIHRFTDNQKERKYLKDSCMQKKMTFRDFRDILLSKIGRDNVHLMQDIIDEEFSKVRLSWDNLRDCLNMLQIPFNDEVLLRLFAVVDNYCTYPYVFAEKLRQALIEEGIVIKDPYQLELVIYHHTDLPLTICFGDSNWTNDHSEAPKHPQFLIRASMIDRELHFWLRFPGIPGKECMQPNYKFENIQIAFPPGLEIPSTIGKV